MDKVLVAVPNESAKKKDPIYSRIIRVLQNSKLCLRSSSPESHRKFIYRVLCFYTWKHIFYLPEKGINKYRCFDIDGPVIAKSHFSRTFIFLIFSPFLCSRHVFDGCSQWSKLQTVGMSQFSSSSSDNQSKNSPCWPSHSFRRQHLPGKSLLATRSL